MKKLIYLLFICFSIAACTTSNKTDNTLTIGISKTSGSAFYEKYTEWVSSYQSNFESIDSIIIIDFINIPFDSVEHFYNDCDGIIISGGPDVNPAQYNMEDPDSLCDPPDNRRDTLELLLIEKSFADKKPLLGICRGMQISNVAQGGTLFFDIPAEFDTLIKHRAYRTKAFHSVDLHKNTLIHSICKIDSGWVNSSHHQGVRDLANEFIATSHSLDGFIESIEWKDKSDKGYFIAVQWHPEHLKKANTLSGPIGQSFIQACLNYKK